MPRTALGDAPLTLAEKQARVRSKAQENGGKTVALQLSAASVEAIAAIRAAHDLTSDRAAIDHALAKVAKSLARKKA